MRRRRRKPRQTVQPCIDCGRLTAHERCQRCESIEAERQAQEDSMTPTPEQLAAVLPRCSAGLDGGDWTDDDERLAWARRVLRYVEEASARAIPSVAELVAEQAKLTSDIHEIAARFLPTLMPELGYSPAEYSDDAERWTGWMRLESPDSAPESPQSDANADQVPQDPGNDSGETTGVSRDPHDIRHGDTWEARDDRATIVASNDWPPPAKGSHESDLVIRGEVKVMNPFLPFETPQSWDKAYQWSRTPDHPPAPGITYHNAEEAQ